MGPKRVNKDAKENVLHNNLQQSRDRAGDYIAGCNIISFCMDSRNALYVFLPDGVFLPCDHGLDFDVSLLA